MPIYNSFIPNLVISDSQDIFDINDSQDYVKKSDTFDVWRRKTNWLIQNANNDIALGTETSGNYVSSITGTAKRVLVTGSGESAAVTLSTPQDIDSQASPTFSSLKIGSNYTLPSASPGGADKFLKSVTGSNTLAFTTIPSFVGTNNQISIASSGTDNSVKTFSLPQDIASNSEVTFEKVTAPGGFVGNASSATKLATARTISLTGDVTGSVNFDGTANVNISTTIANDKVALGTDTTGNYISTITGTNKRVNVTGSGVENASVVLSLPQDIDSQASPQFGNITIGSGSNGTLTVPSGLVTLNGQAYKFPAAGTIESTIDPRFLRLNTQDGTVYWDIFELQTSIIVFEDVIPVGTIVRWDDYDTLPSTKWLRLTTSTQAISSLNISDSDKTKLNNIYTSGNIPAALSSGVDGASFGTSPYTNNSNRIIKIASDNVVDFRVQLGDGITGTKNGLTTEYFDGTSANNTNNLVTLKVDHDTNTLAIASGTLKVKDNTFLRTNLSTTSGTQTVNGKVTFTSSNQNSGGSLRIFETVGSTPGVNGQGSLVIEHGDSQGISSITFPSKYNRGSDYGFITYEDDYADSQNKERSILSIGTKDDYVSTSVNRDVLSLQQFGGSVGIGTNNPTAQVDILATSGESVSYPGIRIRKTNAGFTSLHNDFNTSDYNPIVASGDKGIIFSRSGNIDPTSGGYVIAPWRTNTSGLRITHDGKVGIGVQTPSSTLHVAGSGLFHNEVKSLQYGRFNEGIIGGKARKHPIYHFTAQFGSSFISDTGFRIPSGISEPSPDNRVKQKLMTVVFNKYADGGDLNYKGIGFKIDIDCPQSNHGNSLVAKRSIRETHYINCSYSDGANGNGGNPTNKVTITGPSDRFSAYTISEDAQKAVYEIYINKSNNIEEGGSNRNYNGTISEIVYGGDFTVTYHDEANRQDTRHLRNIFISSSAEDALNKRFRLAVQSEVDFNHSSVILKSYLSEHNCERETSSDNFCLYRFPGSITGKTLQTTGTFEKDPTVGLSTGVNDILTAGNTLPIRWARKNGRNLDAFPKRVDANSDAYYKVAELYGGGNYSPYGTVRISGSIGGTDSEHRTGFDIFISESHLRYGGKLTTLSGDPKKYADFVIYKDISETNRIKYNVYLVLRKGQYCFFDFLVWGDQKPQNARELVTIFPCPSLKSQIETAPVTSGTLLLVSNSVLESCESLIVNGGFFNKHDKDINGNQVNGKDSRVEIKGFSSLRTGIDPFGGPSFNEPLNKDSLIVNAPSLTTSSGTDIAGSIVGREKWPKNWGGGIRTWDILCSSVYATGSLITEGDIKASSITAQSDYYVNNEKKIWFGENSNNSDPMAIGRKNTGQDTSELRIQIGDNYFGNAGQLDALVIGAVGTGRNITKNTGETDAQLEERKNLNAASRTTNDIFKAYDSVTDTGFKKQIIFSSNGDITTVGNVTAYSSSDRNLKENIQNIENPIEKIQKINGVSFTWNEEKQSSYKGKDIGVIAQEIEAVLPEIVTTRDDGTKAVKYERIVALLIEGIKDLQKQIDELKNR